MFWQQYMKTITVGLYQFAIQGMEQCMKNTTVTVVVYHLEDRTTYNKRLSQ